MSAPEVFLWGFGGSVAMEIVAALPIFQADEIIIPERYKRKLFWLIRLLLAAVAGALALAYDTQTRLPAANVGASAPLLLQALGQGLAKG